MTADHRFLKDAHIEPCEIAEPRWMTWRAEEIEDLRAVTARQGELISEQGRDLSRWKLIAIAGWMFAAMLFSIPIIERAAQ